MLLVSRRATAIAVSCVLLLAALVGWRYLTWPRPTSSLAFAAEIAGRRCELTSEVFLPRITAGLPRRQPAVILLHGIEGATRYRWERYVTAARWRDEGYAVFIVHYFGACDYHDLWKFTADGDLDHDAIEQHRLADQQKWVAAVTSAIREISQRNDVDPQRIAIDGFSLGGFISLTAAQEALADAEAPDIRCVICNWGAKFRGTEFTAGLPPTLLVHGELDNVVELKWAEQTRDELERSGADVQLYVVPAAPHMASDAVAEKLRRAFLARHLQVQSP